MALKKNVKIKEVLVSKTLVRNCSACGADHHIKFKNGKGTCSNSNKEVYV